MYHNLDTEIKTEDSTGNHHLTNVQTHSATRQCSSKLADKGELVGSVLLDLKKSFRPWQSYL